jgi:hypothetical protein
MGTGGACIDLVVADLGNAGEILTHLAEGGGESAGVRIFYSPCDVPVGCVWARPGRTEASKWRLSGDRIPTSLPAPWTLALGSASVYKDLGVQDVPRAFTQDQLIEMLGSCVFWPAGKDSDCLSRLGPSNESGAISGQARDSSPDAAGSCAAIHETRAGCSLERLKGPVRWSFGSCDEYVALMECKAIFTAHPMLTARKSANYLRFRKFTILA